MGGVNVDFTNTQDKGFDILEPKAPEKETVKENIQEATQPTQEPNQDLKTVLESSSQSEPKPKAETKEEEKPQISAEQVENFIRENYFKDREFTSLDDAFKPIEPQIKEVEKVVNPWEDVIDEHEEAYFKFKRETGNGRKEWDFIQKDISKMSLLDLAQQKVQKDTGIPLSMSETKDYLEKKLNIDFSEAELSSTDKLDLNAFVNPFRNELLEQQKQFLKPLDESQRKPKISNEPLYTLPNGEHVTKEKYEKHINTVKQDYLRDITEGVSSATPLEFSIKLDDTNDQSEFNFKYEFSKDDKHSMLSDAKDVDAMLQRRYGSESGFDHSRLAKGLWLGDENNLQKIITAVVQSARAEWISERASRSNNEVFSPKNIEKSEGNDKGYGSLEQGLQGNKSTFGVKTNF